MNAVGLYLHVPFCLSKCAYCDFLSYPGRAHEAARYFQAVSRELDWYVRQQWFEEYALTTIYIGGGTPSLVLPDLLAFLHAHQHLLRLDRLDEVTIEVNPGTISPAQFHDLRQIGITRVSIGVQSFDDRELATLGRVHTRTDAIACVQAARQAGFSTISLDLIFGIPSSSLATWQSTLQQALRLRPEHLSFYNLTLEEGTPFWKQHQTGTLVLPGEDEQLAMYAAAIKTLTHARYEHYEISNAALPGYRSQHNQMYW
ncbi:radical SAM family heme chaperone HemW, partial [candidate division KSB3 bacterium]|nr:radical SAM family heme chaperone HemW [candidate division KSB3 bacterium]MBD3326890.1 radical SAM family heme chaperone HemW [candidate division KSB3 bacterium]